MLDERRGARPSRPAISEAYMLDILFIAIAAGFFLIAIVYTHACERLRGGTND
jgi:hypothetical protein